MHMQCCQPRKAPWAHVQQGLCRRTCYASCAACREVTVDASMAEWCEVRECEELAALCWALYSRAGFNLSSSVELGLIGSRSMEA